MKRPTAQIERIREECSFITTQGESNLVSDLLDLLKWINYLELCEWSNTREPRGYDATGTEETPQA